MSNLLLDSLEISNFRAFEHLKIEKLGRVNLIVGENSVGKTALLEAIRIYVEQGSSNIIREVLKYHGELNFPISKAVKRQNNLAYRDSATVASLRYLFHGRPEIKTGLPPIQIGKLNSVGQLLRIEPAVYVVEQNENGASKWVEIEGNNDSLTEPPRLGIAVQIGDVRKLLRFNSINFSLENGSLYYEQKPFHYFIPSYGIPIIEMKTLWNNITLSDLENDVNIALRIISKQIERAGFVETEREESVPVPIIRLTNMDTPIPLHSLGEGLDRIFGIVLSLVNCQNSILLIDEFENGLHHSVQLELWKVIFKLAHRLNVQVFATTHSWDCITAFQEASEQDENEEAMLIRLDKKDERIVVTLYDERLLEMATRIGMDIRG